VESNVESTSSFNFYHQIITFKKTQSHFKALLTNLHNKCSNLLTFLLTAINQE